MQAGRVLQTSGHVKEKCGNGEQRGVPELRIHPSSGRANTSRGAVISVLELVCEAEAKLPGSQESGRR